MTKTKASPSALLLTSRTLPTMPGPREFVGFYGGPEAAQSQVTLDLGHTLVWSELPSGSYGFSHYTQYGASPVRIWTANHPSKSLTFVVLEF